MSHEVTIRENGTAEAAYALTPAWHKLGTVIDHPMTSPEAIRFGHLDWLVKQCKVFAHDVIEVDGKPETRHIEISDSFANIRVDNGHVLGIVSDRYVVVQNWEAFDFVDALYKDGIIRYEAVGSLKDGKLVWLLARMPNEFQVAAQDKLHQYILFTTAHDGSRAVRVLPTSVRVVCWNTLSLATANESTGISIRHKGDIKTKLDDARKAIMQVQKRFDVFHDKAAKLTKVNFDVDKMKALVEVLLPKENGVNDTRRQKAREAIVAAFTDGPQNLPEIRGTAWAAFNAVTQFTDHCPIVAYRGKGNNDEDTARESRMESVLLGSNARFKTSALNLVSQAALID